MCSEYALTISQELQLSNLMDGVYEYVQSVKRRRFHRIKFERWKKKKLPNKQQKKHTCFIVYSQIVQSDALTITAMAVSSQQKRYDVFHWLMLVIVGFCLRECTTAYKVWKERSFHETKFERRNIFRMSNWGNTSVPLFIHKSVQFSALVNS